MTAPTSLPPLGDGQAMDAWVAEHLDAPETIWQAFRDFPEAPPAPEPDPEDTEAEEAELAALLGYAEQMQARSLFSGADLPEPFPMDFGMEFDTEE